MEDYLGNKVGTGDTVIIAVKQGRTAGLGRGFVKDMAMRKQFTDGPLVEMVLVEWSNIHKYWMPAKRVVKIPDEMLPEKRRQKLNDTEEGIVASSI